MILDQNSLEGEDGQLLIVGEGEAATLVEGGGLEGVEDGGYTLANDQNGGMIVLPSCVSNGNAGTNRQGGFLYKIFKGLVPQSLLLSQVRHYDYIVYLKRM